MSSRTGQSARTIEFELSAEELHGLSHLQPGEPAANLPTQSSGIAAEKAPVRRRLRLRRSVTALFLCIAPALLLAGILWRQVSKPAKQPRRPMVTLPAAPAPTDASASTLERAPVRFANPFDATEVFEFPPGTSVEEAREAAAEILINRARGRHFRHERRSAVRHGRRES